MATNLKEHLLELDKGDFDFENYPMGSRFRIVIHREAPELCLTLKSCKSLVNHRRFPRNKDLRLIPKCGFVWKNYYELLLGVHSFGLYDWPRNQFLKFKLGSTLVEVGRISHAFAFLLEPIYHDEDVGQEDFINQLLSIRLINAKEKDKDLLLQEALYYLNSYYLKPVKGYAHLSFLLTEDDYLHHHRSLEYKNVTRTRLWKRKKHLNIEPLLLFNQAVTDSGEIRFLGFYRVLEYFFYRTLIKSISKLRSDPNITEDDIIKTIRKKSELDHLIILARTVLSGREKQRLLALAKRSNLCANVSVEGLAKALYNFRNSIVHAKEELIQKAYLPNPLEDMKSLESWCNVVEMLATSAIKGLNH